MPSCEQCSYTADTAQQVAVHTFSAHERKKKPKPINHGSVAGYNQHKRRGQSPCAKCLRAWREYYQKKRSSS